MGEKMSKQKTNTSKGYRKSFFKTAVISTSVLFIALILIVGAVQIGGINRSSDLQLNSVSIQLDLLYNNLVTINQQILADENMVYLFMAEANDEITPDIIADTRQRLRAMAAGYDSIRFIGFYNAAIGLYIGSSYTDCPSVAFCESFFYGALDASVTKCGFIGLRRYFSEICPNKPPHAYTFIFPISLYESVSPNLIVIDLDTDYIDGILNQLRIEGRVQHVIIANTYGDVITARTASQDEYEFRHIELSLNILDMSHHEFFSRRGLFTTTATANRIEWKIINMVSHFYILSQLAPVAGVLAALLVICLLWSYGLSKKADDKLYKLVYDMHSEAHRLEQGLIGVARLAYRDIISLIQEGDIKSCEDKLDDILHSISDVDFKSIQECCRHIAVSILEEFILYFGNADAENSILKSRLETIDKTEDVTALRQTMVEFFQILDQQFDALRKSSQGDAVMRVKDHIDQNFSEINLSLSLLAEQVDLTPAYLGQLFAARTGMHFNDYLTHVRMSKAVELLSETEEPIKNISNLVGILNTTYFYALFKKQYNMTPSQYRKKRVL